MRRIASGLLILFAIIGLCACSHLDNNTGKEPVNMEEEITRMEEHTVKEGGELSIATNMNEDGELKDYVDISIEDAFVEKEKIAKASLDLLKDVTGVFIDDKGNLLEGYSFVGVKLKINSKKDLNINTASFLLRGVSQEQYFDASCFYQDGKRISEDLHDGGTAQIQKGTTEITVGFFADEDMMNCEKLLLIPTVIETEDSQNNYIEILTQQGK